MTQRKRHHRPNRKHLYPKKIAAMISLEHLEKIRQCQVSLHIPTLSETIRHIIDTWRES